MNNSREEKKRRGRERQAISNSCSRKREKNCLVWWKWCESRWQQVLIFTSLFSLSPLHSLSFLSCEERKVCKILQETPSFLIFPYVSCLELFLSLSVPSCSLTTTRPLIEMHDQSSLLSCLLWLLWAISISSSPAVSQEKKKRQEREGKDLLILLFKRSLCFICADDRNFKTDLRFFSFIFIVVFLWQGSQ